MAHAVSAPELPAAVRGAVLQQDRVKTRLIDRVAMASDASHYDFTPRAVIEADSAEEVARVLKAATANSLPVTFRAGGTSLSGQSCGDGLLVDVRKRFRHIEVLDGGQRVRVGSGATIAQANARLARYRRRLGPDPASEGAAAIGGMIANNSSGMACGTELNTYKTLESMVLVLPSALIIDTADPAGADAHLRAHAPDLHEGLLRLKKRVRENPESVAAIERMFSLKNTMGYGINAFLDADSPVEILQKLVIGSEGTLGFVAEATLRTVPIPALTTTALAVFPTLDAATRCLPDLVGSSAATLELMDATSIAVGQRLATPPAQIMGFDPVDQAALLIEYRADHADELAAGRDSGLQILSDLNLQAPAEFSEDPAGRAQAWKLRKGLYASVAGARPSGTTALLEDVVVPPALLADTCGNLHHLFTEFGYSDCVIFGHAKDGNIHFMLTDRFEGDDALGRLHSFTEKMAGTVLDAGGNLKAEHGTGRAMAPFVRRQYGDELYDVMREVKRLCDPAGILNPGVIISDDPRAHVENIKLHSRVEEEVDRCVECGFCEPVCPSKDLTLTPRQRIVVRRAQAAAVGAGDTDVAAELAKDYDYDGVQTCAVDGMCVTACPVGINTAHLVKRLRRENAQPAQKAVWSAAAKGWGPLGRGASVALNVADRLPEPLVRGASEAARAVAGTDNVPRYSGDLPGGGPARSGLGRFVGADGGEVVGVYVPACVGAMFGESDAGGGCGCGNDGCSDGACGDSACGGSAAGEHVSPAVVDAFPALLERAGVRMIVPDGIDGVCCGTPWSSKGQAAGYEINKKRSRERIAAAVADSGLPVVSDAVSCTEGFISILEGSGVTVVDAVAFTAHELLPRLDVTPREGTLVLHPTCSSTHMGVNDDLLAVARAAYTDVVVPNAWGCCAFAGDRGMLHPELTASATAAEAAEVAGIDADAYASLNRTCELGMSRATGEHYDHVLGVLAGRL